MTEVGPYALRTLLGEGSFGEVWAAVHGPTGTRVALKLLRNLHTDGRLELQREAQALAALTHPGIARIHDLGTDPDERPWLAMELGEGTLGERPPADTERLREVLLELLAALGHAHARGVLHRDLKPSNVVWVRGRPKLVDFGIAVLGDRVDTQDHAGTPLYVAPEQLRGDPDELGPWTDLYALGWLTWELCSGVHPWAHRPAWTLAEAHLLAEPPAWPSELPPELGAWVRRCLAKSPRHRFRRAADAAWALLAVPMDRSIALERRVPPPSTTFTFSALPVPILPAAVEDAGPTPTPPPFSASWRPTRAWEPEPLALAGLGLFALRRMEPIGREAIRDRLWAELGEVVAGRTRAVAVRSMPGMGRTTLARWLCERAHETGAASRWTVAPASDADPWSALRASLARALRRWGVPPELPPETGETLRTLVDGGRLPEEVRWAVLADWLAAVSVGRPRVVWIEDAHRAPDLVAGVRAMLARGAGRTLFLITVDAGFAGADGVVPVDLGPLDPDEGRQLVRGLLGMEDLAVVRLIERTSGHPAYTLQLVADWVDRGWLVPGARGFHLREGVEPTFPEDLHHVCRDRVARLGLSAQELADLRTVASWEACGGRGDGRLWRALGDRGRRLRARIWPLGWLADEDGVAVLADRSLRDGLVRGAEEDGVSGALHAACAALLRPDEPDRRGLHLLHAGDPGAAAPLLVAAIRHALAHGLLARAVELIEQARGCLDPDLATVFAARIAYVRGEFPRCRDLAVAVAERSGPALHEAALWAGQALLLTGPSSEAERWIGVALASAPTGADAESVRRTRAEVLLQLGRLDEAEEILAPIRSSADPFVRAAAWHTSASVAGVRGRAELALRTFERAVEEHRANQDRYREILARIGLAEQLQRLGRLDDAVAAYEEAIRMASAIGSSDGDLARLNLAWLLVERGSAEQARPWFAVCRRTFVGIPVLEAVAVVGALTCAGLAGEDAEFDRDLLRLRELLTPQVAPDVAEIVERAVQAWAVAPERAEAVRRAWSEVGPPRDATPPSANPSRDPSFPGES